MSDEWRTRCKFPTKREADEGVEDAKPIRNLYDLSLKLLRGVSDLSVAATSHIKDTTSTTSTTTSTSSNTEDKDVGMNCILNLDEVYALEPSTETFSLLYEILQFLVSEFEKSSSSSESTIEMIERTLNLLSSNFRQLVASDVDPIEVGIKLASNTSTTTSATQKKEQTPIPDLLKLLKSLMERENVPSSIRVSSAEVIHTGLVLLYPEPRVRAELLSSLITRQKQSPSSSTNSPHYILLNRLLRRFASNRGVVSLLPLKGQFDLFEERSNQIMSLLEQLFDVVVCETEREIRRVVSVDDDDDDNDDDDVGKEETKKKKKKKKKEDQESLLLISAGMLLRSYQRHLLSLSGSCTSSKETPMLLLGRYASLLIHQSNEILQELIQVSTSSRQAELMRVAESSILKTLLPTFVTGLCLFSNSQNIAWRVLPHLVSMIRKLRDFVSSHEFLRDAERAMSKLSAQLRDERDIQVVDLNSALSSAGPRKINAVMCTCETSSGDVDGIVIKESGTIVETTKTIPQYSCTWYFSLDDGVLQHRLSFSLSFSLSLSLSLPHTHTHTNNRYRREFRVGICSMGI